MVTTFASPLIKIGAKATSKSTGNIFANLFKNRGVQAGIGLGATGIGVGILGQGTKSAVGAELSPVILIVLVIVVGALLLRGRR